MWKFFRSDEKFLCGFPFDCSLKWPSSHGLPDQFLPAAHDNGRDNKTSFISNSESVSKLVLIPAYKLTFRHTKIFSLRGCAGEWKEFCLGSHFNNGVKIVRDSICEKERERIVALLWHLKPSCCRYWMKIFIFRAAGFFLRTLLFLLLFFSLLSTSVAIATHRKHMLHEDISQFFWSDKLNLANVAASLFDRRFTSISLS